MPIRFQISNIKRAGRDAGPHYFLWWRPRVSRGARHLTALKANWSHAISTRDRSPKACITDRALGINSW